MADLEYKGWVIEAQSYKSDNERWRPRAVVSIHEGGTLRTNPVSSPLSVTFDTEQEADVYAVEMAKKLIDDRG